MVLTNCVVVTLNGTFHSGISSQNTLQISSQIFLKTPVRGACLVIWLFGIYNYNTALLCLRDCMKAGEMKAFLISSRIHYELFLLSNLRDVCLELMLC